TTARHTLQISAADYITFQNMTIQGTGTTYAWPVFITNGADNVTLKKCKIETTAPVNANTGTFSFMGVVVAGSQSNTPSTTNVENLLLDSNSIIWATYGIYALGNSSIFSSGHTYRANNILYCDRGIDVSSFRAVKIEGNTINNRSINANSNIGINLNSVTANSANELSQITSNKITNCGAVGINLQNSNQLPQLKGLIANNMIGGGFRQNGARGISLSSSSNWMIYHNSINHNYLSTSTSESPLYLTGSAGISVVNNILARMVSGSGQAMYTTGAALDTFANNIIYELPSDTSLGIVYIWGATYYPRTIGNVGQGNIYRIPGFTNDTTLTIGNRCNHGYLNTVVTRDINGDLRSTPPDIGADELPSSGVDAEASAILWPASPATPGLSSVRVQFRNVGGTNLTALRVNYRLNNGPLRSMNWTGNLPTCDTTSIIFTALQQGNFSQSVNSIVAWVDLPNGQADPFPANDTVRTNVYLALSGTYTIGGATADFPNFASAVSMLRTSGVGGAVEFLVNPGTYNERVVIDFNIVGSSATNTVTFNGGNGNRNTRIISFSNLNSSNQSVVLLQGCRYVTFKNLTIQNTSTSSGYGINMMLVGSTTSNITIKSCKILQLGAGATSTSQNYAGIIASGSAISYTNVKMDSITIDSNEISGGFYGYYNSSISSTLSLALRITNNTFIGIYYTAVYINYVENVRINYNTITTPEGIGNFGIYCGYVNTTIPDYATQIIGNKIPSIVNRGIYIQNCSNPITRKGIIANNVIGGGPMISTTATGIYLISATRWMIHHNTVNMTNPGTTNTTYAAMYFSSGTSISIVNNIFARTVAGSGHTFYSASTSGIDTFNYNHFYKLDTTAGIMYYGGTRYPATFKNVYGGNANSIFKPTSFVSDSNMQITDECNNGMILGTVLTDINGVTRNTIPDMGAYEIQGVTNDIGVEFIHPLAIPLNPGPRQINIRLRNYGANIVGTALIKYSFNNMAPQTVNWSGTLLPCDTANVAFTLNIPNGFSRLRIYTVAPNTLTDANFSNDTFERVISTSLSGSYTIGGTTPDFTNFTDAVAALDVAGVSGAVVFNVRPGIYNEQILLNVISGASITNTV
ncbi:MAG: right-handed parallel beta-helix repeat-containing protein, partial [Bacteroidia bacterium]|nr:right-handed parallel beta-helix repeat-containing protein [Bacteroidia bacterium]